MVSACEIVGITHERAGQQILCNNMWDYTDLLFEYVLSENLTREIEDTILCLDKLLGYDLEGWIGIYWGL